VRLGLPSKLVGRATPRPNGASYASAHGKVQIETCRRDATGTRLETAFDQQCKDPARRIDTAVYVRADMKRGEVRGAIIRYRRPKRVEYATGIIVDAAGASSPSARRRKDAR
jgi:hypothetical protein